MVKLSNPCTRCGKERVFSKTWTETIDIFAGTTEIVRTVTVCPDAECQKLVEERLLALQNKRDELKHDLEQKMLLSKQRKAQEQELREKNKTPK